MTVRMPKPSRISWTPFAERKIKSHAEPSVNRIKLDLRQFHHLAPDAEIFLVAGLKFYQFRFRGFESRRILIALGVDDFVKPFELGNRVAFEIGMIQNRFPAEQ